MGPRSLDSTASMFLCTLQPLLSDACFVVSGSTHFLASLVHCGGPGPVWNVVELEIIERHRDEVTKQMNEKT